MTIEAGSQAQETDASASLKDLHLLHRGKVRDVYAVDEHRLLIVATDRVSAFDVVLPQTIPDKGKVLTSLSAFWFKETGGLLRNHLIETDVRKMPPAISSHASELAGRSMLVHRTVPLKAEFVVRGYLAGSGWAEYQRSGSICGHPLPAGLREADRLPEPILTPTTKAPAGQHDEPITIKQLAHKVGTEVASKAGAEALALYNHAAAFAEERGMILADTKLEFGLLAGNVIVIDELFTPDSSRFWSSKEWTPGKAQDAWDKQIVRDALTRAGWDKRPPAPRLPQDVLDKTRARYLEIHRLLTGRDPS
ncbi:MAG TPA: phosphoribosylaminoimidazolesuccinocarboxamide synthase [Planctomycetota bacterium]|jgi:phosphoribosylaminoimidazole-succinocarboxamide synthase|nr:phosphoribosylaminoimidazolesuccinocarboxamide synthase [Planctomycetota bacterium]HZJ72611.1 phosphoribosylaminoimidazolesuccinocarboxamide synthase [Planctomycetota bacterium]